MFPLHPVLSHDLPHRSIGVDVDDVIVVVDVIVDVLVVDDVIVDDVVVVVDVLVVVNDELVDAPVLVAAVRKITTNDDRDLALLQLFHGNLKKHLHLIAIQCSKNNMAAILFCFPMVWFIGKPNF